MTKPLPLRERKKLATRNALIACARRLFAERGYENTTLEEICEEVQIHVTTFFSYFQSKEELAFARTLEALQALKVKLATHREGQDVLSTWWEFYHEFDVQERAAEGLSVARSDAVPALRNRFAIIQRQYEDLLAVALAEEAGKQPSSDLYSQLQATVLMSTLVTASRWYRAEVSDATVADTGVFARMAVAQMPSRTQVNAEEERLRALAKDKRRSRPGKGPRKVS